jgi:transcriptional regulator with XRE-family HTH domain
LSTGKSATKSTLGQAIKEARKIRHLSLRDLARQTGLNAGYISLLERDKRVPDQDRSLAILKLGAFLGIDLAQRTSSSAPADSPHHCQFLDFAEMVADYAAMRRVVLALTGSEQERKRAKKILEEALRLKKMELSG